MANQFQVFSLDPDRFPLSMMQDLNHYLHGHNQRQIVMVDPAVAYQDYPPYNNGAQDDIWLKRSNGSYWLGVVWPGVTVFPDVSQLGTKSRPIPKYLLNFSRDIL